ncbi:MAG: 1-acyl-sn-glycerol-3-phosphate acyltransferase [Myxococcales bacterium]|nr:1-acyl-sn-glycerol-3-phosphate acyltransferase [Myxococcales bacterium]
MAEQSIVKAQQDRVFNPSAMATRQGWVLRLVARLLFGHVRFDDVTAQKIRQIASQGSLVYVLHSRSLLDYLYFNWAFLNLSLPLAVFAHGFRLHHTLFLRPLGELVRALFDSLVGRSRLPRDEFELLGPAIQKRQPTMVFLKPPQSLLSLGGGFSDEAFRVLVAQQKLVSHDIYLLPQIMIWARRPDKFRKSESERVFGNPDAPGSIRKLLSFILHRRTAFVQVGEPVNLRTFLAALESGGRVHVGLSQGEPESSTVSQPAGADPALALRSELHIRFGLESRVIRGPVLKSARQIQKEMMRNTDFEAQILAIAKEQGIPKEKALRQVERYLKEMAADFRMWMIELFCLVLHRIWGRMYVGIEVDEAGLDKLRQAGRQHPLILVPTHRSHIDYLIISYLFYLNGLIPPYIAAGVNLSFFPMGYLFRRAGAFFIRRSFKDNPLYGLTFRYYLRKIIKEGHWVEFFPEGGRSRTGKALPPKLGMIRDIVADVRDGNVGNVYFCPVSISYEKIVEESAYSRELSGAAKQEENVGAVIKAGRVLFSKHGRVYVRFAEPLSVQDYLTSYQHEHGVTKLEESTAVAPGTTRHLLRQLAYTISYGMNQAAVVSPSALVAMVLLAHPRPGITRTQLMLRVGYLMMYVRDVGGKLSETLASVWEKHAAQLQSAPPRPEFEKAPPGSLAYGQDLFRARVLVDGLGDVVEETLALFMREKTLDVVNYGDELAYSVVRKRRVALDFYKNNIMHLLAGNGILASVISVGRAGEWQSVQEVMQQCRFLSRLLRLEFVYVPGVPFEVQFQTKIDHFIHRGWLQRDQNGNVMVPEAAAEAVLFFANSVRNIVEGYWLALHHLRILEHHSVPEKQWISALQKKAEAMAKDGLVRYPESATNVLFSNALEVCEQHGLIFRDRRRTEPRAGKSGKTEVELRMNAQQATALTGWEATLRRILVCGLPGDYDRIQGVDGFLK